MTLKELKEEAAKILQLASNPPQGFEFEMFTTGSGGVPANKVGIKYASQREWVVYSTASNGDAMASETIILCADTGAKDKEGRTIWITPESVVFVWDKWAGSPEDFDRGNFISPSFN